MMNCTLEYFKNRSKSVFCCYKLTDRSVHDVDKLVHDADKFVCDLDTKVSAT